MPPPPDLQRCVPACGTSRRNGSSTRHARSSRRGTAHESAPCRIRAPPLRRRPAGLYIMEGLARLGVNNLLACPRAPIAEPARAHARVFERAMKGRYRHRRPCGSATDPRAASRPGAPARPPWRRPVGGVGAALAGVPCVLSRGWTTRAALAGGRQVPPLRSRDHHLEGIREVLLGGRPGARKR